MYCCCCCCCRNLISVHCAPAHRNWYICVLLIRQPNKRAHDYTYIDHVSRYELGSVSKSINMSGGCVGYLIFSTHTSIQCVALFNSVLIWTQSAKVVLFSTVQKVMFSFCIVCCYFWKRALFYKSFATSKNKKTK